MTASIEATGKSGGAKFKWALGGPLTELVPGGHSGRVRTALRVSAEGSKLGFDGTLLANGWVTVEVTQELPHANTLQAQQEAQTRAFQLSHNGIEVGLEMLMAKISEPDSATILDSFLNDPQAAIRAGIAEPMVRAIAASPMLVWQSLDDDEKKELAACYPTSR